MFSGFNELELPLVFQESDLWDRLIEPNITDNAKTVLEARYLKKNLNNEVTETFKEMFLRVASTVAAAEAEYGGSRAVNKYTEIFYNLMASLDFLPNSPTLMNASRGEGQLSACFVLPVGDSMPEIFEAVKQAALIQKSGGGVGYSFSRLRPIGDRVKTTNGVSSGPISFMKVFNEATETVKQGGRRRGANMGVLRIDHPDILEFIDAKKEEGRFFNFNISVAITDDFMKALENGSDYELVNPRSGVTVEKISAQMVWDKIVNNAWENAEPGILFIDRINRDNPTPKLGSIESTNPCGEACLLPYEACNLGSINLSRFTANRSIDYKRLGETVRLAVRFLDDVIDVNEYVPHIPKIRRTTLSNRKIGLGVMGFSDMLISLGISYKDPKALKIADQVMEFISREGKKASMELALERGPFPNWKDSILYPHCLIRNAVITSIAPTGTLSIIAGCSPGIEPLFGVCFERNVLGGKKLLEIHPLFEKIAKQEGFYSLDLMKNMSGKGTIQDMEDIPKSVRELFITSHDISGEGHVLMQAAFQKHVDMSVSKTINLPADSTREEVDKIYRLAYKNGLKGITVYRYGSRQGQVIVLGKSEPDESEGEMEECLNINSEDIDFVSAEEIISIAEAPHRDSADNTSNPNPNMINKTSVIMDTLPETNPSIMSFAERKSEACSSLKPGNGGKTDAAFDLSAVPSMFTREIPCPDCGQGTLVVGACSVCQHCGYSKCG